MDCPDANVPGSGSTHGSNDDVHVPRVKFLCSFLGSILPRPQDGKLRYVGGETRIVCLPRDVTYEESMSRMRELYEGAVVLKYQQPDEDLDALVSVVNDDDVTNMMEEYDKLGSGDGFTRLRIFLFSHPDQVGSNHYIDGDDWEWDRRYVDAQNSLNDGNDYRKLQYPDSPVISSIDDVHMAEWFFNTMNLESGIHNLPQYNVHDLTVPHMSSGQHQQPVSERYNEREGPWSPAYYSPRHYAHHDPPRPLPEFPSSPPSSRIRMPFGEERIPKEHARQHLNHHPTYKPHPQVSENFVWMPPGTVSGDRTGFPGNLFHGHNVLDGNSTCENCQLTFHRNQLHLDQPNMGNGLPQVPISCAECRPNRENLVLNAEAKLSHCMYSKDNDSLSVYNESHRLERGWVLQHQLNPRLEEARTHMSGAGRVNDHYLVDGPGRNIPPGHSNLVYSTIGCGPGLINNNVAKAVRTDENHNLVQEKEANHVEKFGNTDVKTSFPEHKMIAEKSIGSTSLQTTAVSGDIEKPRENGPSAPPEDTNLSAHSLSFLPELIASVKSAVLEGAEDVKAKVEDDYFKPNTMPKEAPVNESELVNIHGESEVDSDIDYVKMSTIEPTMAEAEAFARGLQTIKNDDLEEIRELGSGTYGSVYYGKWRGSDVAIKRIKASCFAGRPSERERLIEDFWKEALLLSSLHHPNVVSFYGIVRDGPDGSLATVTEFMVNGSLKQFLRKKDRTIDRRKRLILAMDAAFGMEYLHGKNIVHFDLKCENLLVNMRDPQRPVCKIGDLGLSKVKQQTLVSGGVRGTLPWMAPELLSGKSHMVTEKIDVYSFGIVMWELLTGDEPYAEMHCASIIGGIVNNTLRPQIPTWCDPEWKSLMESCWASDPAERPSFSEISQRLRSMAAAINVK